MKQVRSVDFLPEIFRTPVNRQFLAATLDQLIQNPQYNQTQGFIGRRVGPGVNANDSYVVEPTKTRTDYQLEPGVVQIDLREVFPRLHPIRRGARAHREHSDLHTARLMSPSRNLAKEDFLRIKPAHL